jgi:hypothetical protein
MMLHAFFEGFPGGGLFASCEQKEDHAGANKGQPAVTSHSSLDQLWGPVPDWGEFAKTLCALGRALSYG